MMKRYRFFKITFLLAVFTFLLRSFVVHGQIRPGAQQTEDYLKLIEGKKVGVVAHAASQIYHSNGSTHLIDSLNSLGVQIHTIFAPEHGFLSQEENGAYIQNSIDPNTNTLIVSLHGKERKPQPESLQEIDLMIFDLQDVGVRFYTYLSTLHLVMEACAEQNIPLLLLDRPNPNGHYVDGPVMEDEFKGFLGKHNIPIVHGMTLGEYAQMINGEGWLNNGLKCNLTIIKNKNYSHQNEYNLVVRPSPNLPNAQAINLYPSLCLFEQTPISIGRGTEMQFQIFGSPYFEGDFRFTPKPNFGAKNPKLNNKECVGFDLREHPRISKIELKWLIDAYQRYPNKGEFFSAYFVNLSGTKSLEKQIQNNLTEEEIRASWEPELKKFKTIRGKYLIYED